ncbi:GH24 family phage-related lysozyme (muramidase) [Bradyrhizobium sp. LB7.2]
MYAGKAPATSAGRPIASAYDMISRFEGFKTAPYWDVNHLRVGFGSDTITREDGSVAEVKPGMTVTPADATRDLQRRIISTQGKIAGTVGQDKWDGLSAPAKAAVSSVAYNYGTLPQSVSDAISTGGPAEIAAAIRGLQDQNDGVNKKRRNQEADAVLGINMTAAGRDTQSFFTDMESYLSTIKDPQVQELTRKRINAMLETQHKAQEAGERQAKATLWQYIDQGKTPDQIPMEVRQAAGMAAVSSAWSYMDTVQKGRDVKSDEEMLYGMRRAAAMDPEFFAKVDLNDYRDKLSRADIKELSGLQTSALTDQRKARDAGLELTSAFSQAEQQLAAVGISTKDKKGSQLEEANKRIAQFNNALASQMDEFKRANSDRKPTQADVQSMINRLLLPIVVKTPGTLWGTNTWAPPGVAGTFTNGKTFAFDAASRPDNATVDVAVKYADIPIDLRRGIAGDLERELGRKPSEVEVTKRYQDFVLNR